MWREWSAILTQTPDPRTTSFLAGVADPATAAVLTMELQNGIVTGDAMFPDLVARVDETGTLDAARRLCARTRQAGVRVVQCTKVTRPDGAARAINCKVFALGEKLRLANGRDAVEIGSPARHSTWG